MKLTGELKKKVESAESKEEMKSIIAEAGIELTDEELEAISGGSRWDDYTKEYVCPNCGMTLEGLGAYRAHTSKHHMML